MDIFKSRRSIRSYKEEPIRREELEAILEAGFYAPSGGSNQTTPNKKGYGNAIADSACMLENMMLKATQLHVGSCWINQLHWLDENPVIREKLISLGLGEDETVTGGLVLGYAKTEPQGELKRSGNPVTMVE